jgi:hypothetical protein
LPRKYLKAKEERAMSRAVKGLLITATCFIICGVIIAGGGFTMGGMNPVLIDRDGLQIADYKELEDMETVDSAYPGVRNITVNADMVPIVRIIRGEKFAVKAQNPKLFGGVRAKMDGDTLIIAAERNGPRFFGFDVKRFNIGNLFQNKGYIEITVPGGAALGVVKIIANYPKVTIADLSADSLDVDCAMGGVAIDRVAAGRLRANANMGAVRVRSSQTDDMTITADMGALEARDVTTGLAKVKLSQGGASLIGFESNGLDLDCDMGGVNLDGVLRGKSVIDCDIGGVELKLNQPRDSLSLDVETEVGYAYVNGKKSRGEFTASSPIGALEVSADVGSVEINFAE